MISGQLETLGSDTIFYKKLRNVSCEYDRVNGWNSTLQAAWYIRYLHKLSFARVLCAIYEILLGWKQYEHYFETVELPNPRPTQLSRKIRVFTIDLILLGWRMY